MKTYLAFHLLSVLVSFVLQILISYVFSKSYFSSLIRSHLMRLNEILKDVDLHIFPGNGAILSGRTNDILLMGNFPQTGIFHNFKITFLLKSMLLGPIQTLIMMRALIGSIKFVKSEVPDKVIEENFNLVREGMVTGIGTDDYIVYLYKFYISICGESNLNRQLFLDFFERHQAKSTSQKVVT